MRRSTIVRLSAYALLAVAAHAQSYSLSGDWSDSANPNGPWTCWSGNTPLPGVADWTAGSFGFLQPAWAQASTGTGHIPAWMKMRGNGSGLDVAAGDVMMHSWDPVNGGIGEGVVTWRAPASGTVAIAGSIWMTRDIGRSNDWFLSHGGTLLRSGTVSSGDPYSSTNRFPFAAGTGSEALAGRTVNVGDLISLVVSRSATSFFGDFSGVELTITLAGSPALGACATGGFAGGTALLTVNGSTGAPQRLVHVGLGQPFTIAVAQPPGVPFPAPFFLFGRIGVPEPSESYGLPLGIGTMCFAPALLAPANPQLFTLADSFFGGGLLPATPAPWLLAVPGLSAPLLATLQAVTYENPSTLRATNAIVVDVY